ncbi:APC family permease [Sporichthya brevicatena]|uniref:APC family permease n=1 Tax=Sporichthya brevicatena TaxID=171442 RepID=A0ABN1H1D5_9ACTN
MSFARVPKRILLGTPMRSDRLGDTLLRKRVGLAIFASGPLSSVAYAPQEIFLVLSVAGAAYFQEAAWFGLAIGVLMVVVISSYRQSVREYPGGGGDYDVAMDNLGRTGGLTVASALIVDYVVTVAVSVSAGVDNLGAAVPFVAEHRVPTALAVIAVLMLLNLRGMAESGFWFAIPAYTFVVGVLALIGVGLFRILVLDDDVKAPTADYEVVASSSGVTGLALAFLLVRAFCAGSVALAGVEQSANGVPAFREPKGRNAATVLLFMGGMAITMFAGLVTLAALTDFKVADDPATEILIDGQPAGPDYEQDPIIAQMAEAVFGDGSWPFLALAVTTTLILFFAANTSFNGFPQLGSILARDRWLPGQLRQRGDRLSYSNSIVALAIAAGVLVYLVDVNVSSLVGMYIVAVFISLTLGQVGLAKHWTTLLRSGAESVPRRRLHRDRAVNVVGAVCTGAVLGVVLVSDFLDGAWVVVAAVPVFFAMMHKIAKHYDQLNAELTPTKGGVTLPSRIHGIVLVSKLHTPTLRALAFARATRPDTLVALTVQTSPESTAELLREWAEHDIEVPLTVLDSPYREVTRPVLEYVRNVRVASPRDVICVFVPEYVVGKWWEQLLHNQTPLRLKARLLFQPGVMVTSVPWQLGSAEQLEARRTYKPR